MADPIKTIEYNYKLRAAAPMPVENGKFLLQTFMSERTDTDNYSYIETLPESRQFRGQGGVDRYMSANFSRQLNKGTQVFQGKIVNDPDYTNEEFITNNVNP